LHAKWYIFIEENSVINATSLALLLSEYDYHYDHFIGFSVDGEKKSVYYSNETK